MVRHLSKVSSAVRRNERVGEEHSTVAKVFLVQFSILILVLGDALWMRKLQFCYQELIF